MNKILISTLLLASLSAPAAFASDGYSADVMTSKASQNMHLCLDSDLQSGSLKAIRACTEVFKNAAPNYDVKSEVLTRRGWLQLSAGKYDRAARDFKWAAELNNVNELAYLGNGFSAMMNADYAAAITFFDDCKSHQKSAPLAYYGLGMAKELAGDKPGALEAYGLAAKLSPDWSAPREELRRIKA